MATTDYQIGDQPTFQATFKDANAVPTDPDTIKFLLRDPAGDETVFEFPAGITNPSTGVYQHNATKLELSGRWTYRWNGTGAIVTAGERSIQVDATAFNNPLP